MIKSITTENYDLQDDANNNVWLILTINCPHCNKQNSVKTLDFKNGEIKMKCSCNKKFTVILE